MKVLSIDPGSKESAFVTFNTEDDSIQNHGFMLNEDLLQSIKNSSGIDVLAIESIEGFGLTAGQELFDTCFWSGRFCQLFELLKRKLFVKIGRKKIKVHLCGHSSAKDKDIREALIYRFGEPGIKSAPGKLYGISGHGWAALAVAVYYSDFIQGKVK